MAYENPEIKIALQTCRALHDPRFVTQSDQQGLEMGGLINVQSN